MQGSDYTGLMVHFVGAVFDLRPYGIDNSASSAVILSGKWRFYEGVGFTGLTIDLEPGFYPRAGGDNRLSSLSPIN